MIYWAPPEGPEPANPKKDSKSFSDRKPPRIEVKPSANPLASQVLVFYFYTRLLFVVAPLLFNYINDGNYS